MVVRGDCTTGKRGREKEVEKGGRENEVVWVGIRKEKKWDSVSEYEEREDEVVSVCERKKERNRSI